MSPPAQIRFNHYVSQHQLYHCCLQLWHSQACLGGSAAGVEAPSTAKSLKTRRVTQCFFHWKVKPEWNSTIQQCSCFLFWLKTSYGKQRALRLSTVPNGKLTIPKASMFVIFFSASTIPSIPAGPIKLLNCARILSQTCFPSPEFWYAYQLSTHFWSIRLNLTSSRHWISLR